MNRNKSWIFMLRKLLRSLECYKDQKKVLKAASETIFRKDKNF